MSIRLLKYQSTMFVCNKIGFLKFEIFFPVPDCSERPFQPVGQRDALYRGELPHGRCQRH